MAKSIFREYDIRGIFEKELNEETTKKIGYYFAKRVPGDYIAIGYDARIHSPTLFGWLTSGINAAGKKVLGMGLVPTPVNYFSNYITFFIDGEEVTPAASVMITGSHNPPEYNGFKITVDKEPFFAEQIYSLGQEVLGSDLSIEDDETFLPIDAKERYIQYMVEQFCHLKGLQKPLVVDCGNGAAGVVIEPIFQKLDFRYEGLFCDPDGTFPNHHPDPTIEENLRFLKERLQEGMLGFAYDGDADRIAVLTKKHDFAGDELAVLFAKEMENPTVVGEVKCSQMMYDEINKRGKAIMYKTGHSNLKVKIKEVQADLAAEVSGHIFFNDRYFGYDDAIYTTLRVLELVYNGMDLDREIEKLPKLYHTPEIKVPTTEQEKFRIIEKLKKALSNPPEDFPPIKSIITLDGVRIVFDHGWALVRASNTTPVLVTRFEGDTPQSVELYETAVMKLLDTIRNES